MKSAGHGCKATKKRPRLFSQGRPGSPPPELPNHEMDIKELLILCKRHFGNGDSGGQEEGQIERLKRREELLLLVPGLTVVAGHPEFAGGSGDLAVLWIGEIHADNVARQRGVRL